ncbi:hypothetical protein KOR42_15990 [Thalassoglobus neptunius]|uniref:Uncharacterized protein n=1 Tax=Thalassoglobus neptunius TaxID=1938619 RepID=A0A5C5X635_9PLAN|nr:hypothetical protein KOR42_15990 [Thalassoglobus neptunius]
MTVLPQSFLIDRETARTAETDALHFTRQIFTRVGEAVSNAVETDPVDVPL